MKKAFLLTVAAVFCMFGASAVSAQGKWGPDSAECIKYLSYYSEYYKQKNYDAALPNWRMAYKLCPPSSRQTMLVDGQTLMRKLISKNANNSIYVAQLVDTLMTLYDYRVQYFPKNAVSALNNKAQDMMMYIKDDPERLYNEFKEIIDHNGTAVKPNILIFQMNMANQLYQNGTLTPEDVISEYNDMIGIMDNMKPKTEFEKEQLAKIKSDIESVFIGSNVANCDNLIELYTPRFEANPDSLQLVQNIVRMLYSTEGCQDNDLFINASVRAHELEPSYTTAHFLYQIYSQQGNVDNAIKYMEEAINYPESDNVTDAQYYLELANFCSKEGQYAKAFSYGIKAAELDQNIAGKAYYLIGTVWGSQSCPGNEIEKRAPYWVAVDYLVKAKNADPSLAEDANKLINSYRSYYPQAAEAFMYNVTEGDSYTVSCGGMRAVTTVKTQQ